MEARVEKARDFLFDRLDEGEYYVTHPTEKQYRKDHSVRVCHIGRRIAKQEGMDAEAMTIACLLHDVSYCLTFGENEYVNHGRYSAAIARPFLESIGFHGRLLEDMCYGIAVHVDDKADFEGERTVFALTIGDADNIDRFGAYRILENLNHAGYDRLPDPERAAFLERALGRLYSYKSLEFATATAQGMWLDALELQIAFYERLMEQIHMSRLS